MSHKCLSHDPSHWQGRRRPRGHTLADLVHAQLPAWASKKLRWRQCKQTPGTAGPAPDLRHQPPGSTHFCKQKVGVGYTRYIYRISILIRVYPIDMTQICSIIFLWKLISMGLWHLPQQILHLQLRPPLRRRPLRNSLGNCIAVRVLHTTASRRMGLLGSAG